jgi:hypothetical protein
METESKQREHRATLAALSAGITDPYATCSAIDRRVGKKPASLMPAKAKILRCFGGYNPFSQQVEFSSDGVGGYARS